MGWRTAATFSVAAIVHAIWPQPALAGNTTCASNQMEWYSSVVGESPCVTYERLRQICNINYQVPNFRPNTPGDQCDDQVSACCCNTVAFQLSMLCMNCQYDTEDGYTTGIDAGIGAYTLYRQTCGAGTNHSLPQDIQSAVCNKNIRLDNYLYGGWDDGSWFYVWTKENAGRDHAVNNNNTFTHCPNQISPSVTPTPSSTSHSSSDATPTTTSETRSSSGPSQTEQSLNGSNSGDTSHSNTGAIVGGVVGGLGALGLAIAAFIFWRMQRNRHVGTPATQDHHFSYQYQPDSPPMGSATPFAASMSTGFAPASPPADRYPTTSIEQSDQLSPPSSVNQYSNYQPSAISSDVPRHEDGGPVAGLVRSTSGRLPPAYRSWERALNANAASNGGSNTGSSTGPTLDSVSGYGYGESQLSYGAPAAQYAAPEPQMPLVPLRKE